ncbi:hypothetical protein JCM11641_002934 [Rhodosporidiobolus odoratus]
MAAAVNAQFAPLTPGVQANEAPGGSAQPKGPQGRAPVGGVILPAAREVPAQSDKQQFDLDLTVLDSDDDVEIVQQARPSQSTSNSTPRPRPTAAIQVNADRSGPFSQREASPACRSPAQIPSATSPSSPPDTFSSADSGKEDQGKKRERTGSVELKKKRIKLSHSPSEPLDLAVHPFASTAPLALTPTVPTASARSPSHPFPSSYHAHASRENGTPSLHCISPVTTSSLLQRPTTPPRASPVPRRHPLPTSSLSAKSPSVHPPCPPLPNTAALLAPSTAPNAPTTPIPTPPPSQHLGLYSAASASRHPIPAATPNGRGLQGVTGALGSLGRTSTNEEGPVALAGEKVGLGEGSVSKAGAAQTGPGELPKGAVAPLARASAPMQPSPAPSPVQKPLPYVPTASCPPPSQPTYPILPARPLAPRSRRRTAPPSSQPISLGTLRFRVPPAPPPLPSSSTVGASFLLARHPSLPLIPPSSRFVDSVHPISASTASAPSSFRTFDLALTHSCVDRDELEARWADRRQSSPPPSAAAHDTFEDEDRNERKWKKTAHPSTYRVADVEPNLHDREFKPWTVLAAPFLGLDGPRKTAMPNGFRLDEMRYVEAREAASEEGRGMLQRRRWVRFDEVEIHTYKPGSSCRPKFERYQRIQDIDASSDEGEEAPSMVGFEAIGLKVSRERRARKKRQKLERTAGSSDSE